MVVAALLAIIAMLSLRSIASNALLVHKSISDQYQKRTYWIHLQFSIRNLELNNRLLSEETGTQISSYTVT